MSSPGKESMCSSARAMSSGKAMARSRMFRGLAKRTATPALFADAVAAEASGFTEADDQHTFCLDSFRRVQQKGFTERCFELARGEPGRGGIREGVGGGEQGGRRLLALLGGNIDGKDCKQGRREGCGFLELDRDVHGYIVSWQDGMNAQIPRRCRRIEAIWGRGYCDSGTFWTG